jgi:iron(III) transport system permease protein
VYGAILLIPAVVAFIIDLVNKDKGNSAYVIKPYPAANSTTKKIGAYIGCIIATIYVFLPIVSFVILAFSKDYPNDKTFTLYNFVRAEKLNSIGYLINSIVLAFLVAIIGVCIAFMSAYLSARMKSKVSRFLHLSSITSAAIPGVVLGLSYVLAFKSWPIYGTILILVMVNTIHFMSSPYLMMYNSLSKINENLEDVAHTMGIYRHHMIRDVFIPQCKGTIIEMFSYFFVNCMVTISAVSFLATTINKPLSLMISQFEAQTQLECAAVVSLMILTVNLIVKGIAHLVKNRQKKSL